MDETKHAAQSAYLSAENVRDFYQQLLSEGRIGQSLTRQIAEEKFPEIEPEIQREVDLEPER